MTSQQKFIEDIASHAVACQRKTGIPASVTIAQAILESGWGRSLLSVEANNFFGIKAGKYWMGKVYSGKTWEVFGGKRVDIPGTGRIYKDVSAAVGQGCHRESLFRAYDSFTDCLVDKSKVFYNGLYEDALSYRSQSPMFLKLMAKRYATDPDYATKLTGIIERYRLMQYDVPAKEWQLDDRVVPKKWFDLWVKHALGGVLA